MYFSKFWIFKSWKCLQMNRIAIEPICLCTVIILRMQNMSILCLTLNKLSGLRYSVLPCNTGHHQTNMHWLSEFGACKLNVPVNSMTHI